MVVLVDATTEHPFPITVTVPVESAAKFLADVSDSLDQSGLLRGKHWSLDAEAEGSHVHLRFSLHSQAAIDQIQAAIVDTMPDLSLATQTEEEPIGFGIGGPATGRFLDVYRIPKNTAMQPLKSQDRTDI
ncbi:hypothetical protein ILT44_19760 [Microvirga sp. BT689]|uniref:hypothetical protein n=1 Tax=Microvirga arvi TaxID=2778731 RepID=UPI00194EDCDB|nr:hypothetical protein [Microvirga arvi]MBM6582445.1 hypothetical protein [Microvirga arvi]